VLDYVYYSRHESNLHPDHWLSSPYQVKHDKQKAKCKMMGTRQGAVKWLCRPSMPTLGVTHPLGKTPPQGTIKNARIGHEYNTHNGQRLSVLSPMVAIEIIHLRHALKPIYYTSLQAHDVSVMTLQSIPKTPTPNTPIGVGIFCQLM
jgi:hypothetical protein